MAGKKLLIKSYIFSEIRKFLRDNNIKYTLCLRSIVTERHIHMYPMIFTFNSDGSVSVQKVPLSRDVETMQVGNIYLFIAWLLRLNMISPNHVSKFNIKGITKEKAKFSVSKNKKAA